MKSSHAFWLASTALAAVMAVPPATLAAPVDRPIVLAQGIQLTPAPAEDPKGTPPAAKPGEAVKKPAPPAAPAVQVRPPQPPAQPPAAQAPARPQPPAAVAKPPAAVAKPPAPTPAQAPAAQRSPEAAPQRTENREEKRDEKREQKREDRRDRGPAAATDKSPAPPAKSTPPAAQGQTPPPAAQERRTPPPATAQPKPGAPAPAGQPPVTLTPTAPGAQPPAAAAPTPPTPGLTLAPAAAPPPPTKARDAGEFLRGDGKGSRRGMDDVRKERRETRDGDRTVIREGDRTIVRQGDRTIIRHSESSRFAVGARNVRNDRRGNENISVIMRPNGISIITTTDLNGQLIRRARRDKNGREVIIIDNSFPGARRGGYFVNLPPPVIRMPRERYIVDARRASPAEIYDVFIAPPVQEIEERYTVDQVRYSQPLRDRMPRVDLDINFDSGSWQLDREQVDRLSVIAEALNRAIDEKPGEVFLIEGHTDATGTDEDNLSLSDRRAETVAIALTEQFRVPPENLITQGYGEEYLKVQTDAAEAANRYVAVRRITPLMAQQMSGGTKP